MNQRTDPIDNYGRESARHGRLRRGQTGPVKLFVHWPWMRVNPSFLKVAKGEMAKRDAAHLLNHYIA